MTNIPSDEDFARASRFMEERFRNLDKVCENVKQRYQSLCPLHNVYILPQGDAEFRAYVFFNDNADIEACNKKGIVQEIKNSIYAELERAGRGRREEITVAFEIDSDENVSDNFEGDYFLRLR